MRTIKIIEQKDLDDCPTHFIEETGDSILCAFNLNNFCTPHCAACSILGTSPKAYCNRGVKDDFAIGWIKE